MYESLLITFEIDTVSLHNELYCKNHVTVFFYSGNLLIYTSTYYNSMYYY